MFMVALEFNPLYHTLLVFLMAAVPGLALGWPLLKKSQFSLLEKFALSFFIGLFAVPALLFIENFVGIHFSLALVAVNFLIVVCTGAFWGMKNKAFELKMPQLQLEKEIEEPLEFAKKHAGSMLLLLAMILAFWIRVQTFSPIYSELDPYFYVFATGQIIQQGEVPLTDDTAWYPDAVNSHRGNSLRSYVEAQWYSVYTKDGAYNNYLLFQIAGWLPPIAGALLAFGAYFALSAMFGKQYGILAAFLMAFLPIAVYKMSAGVNEAVGIGVMALFICLGVYIQSLIKKDRALGVISGFAFFVVINGSNYSPVMTIPFGLFLVLQSIDYFARGKWNEDFFEMSAYPFAGFLLGTLAININGTGSLIKGISGLATGTVFLVVGGFALTALINHALHKKIKEKIRLQLVLAVAVVAVLLFFFSPVGTAAKGFVFNYVGAAQFINPLDRTIAEQNEAGTTFEGEGGFVTLVPYSHMASPPQKDYVSNDVRANPIAYFAGAVKYLFSLLPYTVGQLFQLRLDSSCYALLEFVSVPMTFIGNLMLSFIDFFFNTLFGTAIATSNKDDSLLFFFLVIFTLGTLAIHFLRKGESREVPSVLLLSLLFVFPVLYVGLNKIKFTIFAGLMVAYAAAIAMGMAERGARKLGHAMKFIDNGNISKAFLAIILATIMLQATTPSPLMAAILAKSFDAKYQDNPVALMPKLASTCEALRTAGYYDSDICSAGYNISYADTINGQFNSKVCMVSQLSISELMPNSTAAQQSAEFAKLGASFRCNRLSDYWIESMEWIKNNLNDSDRVTSWWDYGHWINYFGEKKTVLRNEHSSKQMIGRVAHDFIIGSNQDLIDSMNYFDSRYVILDSEVIGGSTFGGKYGALNYLGCAHEGLTTVAQSPGSSKCEYDNSPERLIIPKVKTQATTCTISESQQRSGVYAYRVTLQGADMKNPAYCIGDAKLKDGTDISATYYLDRKNADGDLALSKGFLRVVQDSTDTALAEVVYNEQKIWPGENGTWVDGMADAKTAFYRSNLYRGYYLENLPGFDMVFKSKGGEVKIFRMKNFVGNKVGRSPDIDPNQKY